MRWWRRSRSGNDDHAVGADGRPLATTPEGQAEAIRVALRQAGCAESGERHGGFVVDAPGDDDRDPVRVRYPDDPELDRHTEQQRYQLVLGDAGFRTVSGIDDDGGLAVWPADVRPKVPRPSPRTLAEDWLRSLTISIQPGVGVSGDVSRWVRTDVSRCQATVAVAVSVMAASRFFSR